MNDIHIRTLMVYAQTVIQNAEDFIKVTAMNKAAEKGAKNWENQLERLRNAACETEYPSQRREYEKEADVCEHRMVINTLNRELTKVYLAGYNDARNKYQS